jgi:hypothetical protein
MSVRRYRGRRSDRAKPSRPISSPEVSMIRSLQFLGVRTEAFDATVALHRDTPGVRPVLGRDRRSA